MLFRLSDIEGSGHTWQIFLVVFKKGDIFRGFLFICISVYLFILCIKFLWKYLL